MSEPSASNPPPERRPSWPLETQVLRTPVLIAGVWIAYYFLGLVVPYGELLYAPALLALLVYLVWRRRAVGCALIVFLLSPFSVYFLQGLTGYWSGRPTLLTTGLPGTRFYNIDRRYRCEWETMGDLVAGYEWIKYAPNNAATILMIDLFGPARGSYLGPYPTEEEALAALKDAVPVTLDDFLDDRVRVGETEVRLDKGVGRGLIRIVGLEGFYYDELWGVFDPREPGPIRCAIWRERCLTAWIPTNYYGPQASRPEGDVGGRVAVVDIETGRPFAYYGTGDYFHHWPPVSWHRSWREGD